MTSTLPVVGTHALLDRLDPYVPDDFIRANAPVVVATD